MVVTLTPSFNKPLSAETSDEEGLLQHGSPLGYFGTDTNLYRYVANSPTTATDPSGLAEELEIVTVNYYWDTWDKFKAKLGVPNQGTS